MVSWNASGPLDVVGIAFIAAFPEAFKISFCKKSDRRISCHWADDVFRATILPTGRRGYDVNTFDLDNVQSKTHVFGVLETTFDSHIVDHVRFHVAPGRMLGITNVTLSAEGRTLIVGLAGL